MGRIAEAQRIPTVDAILGHYTEAEVVNGAPILIAVGVGRPQLLAKRNQYQDLQEELVSLTETQLANLIAERTAVWGNSPDDEDGIWFQLRLYKPMVRLRLGARHPLSKTVPNLGEVQPGTMGSICHRFEDHWTRVNAALAALTLAPLTLGAFTLALLQAAQATIEAKNTAIEALVEGARPQTRAEMERLYGDVAEDDREEDSLVALMLGYDVVIQTLFPGQPIALSLPRIFPASGPTTLPSFRFNWVPQAGNVIKTWIETPDLPSGASMYFHEGVIELTQAFNPANPGSTQTHLWNAVQVIDELDEFEIRNASGLTLARGTRDNSFAEP
jgi:hypothetical protein